MCKLVQHYNVIEEVAVVFGVGFLSTFLADYDCLEILLVWRQNRFRGLSENLERLSGFSLGSYCPLCFLILLFIMLLHPCTYCIFSSTSIRSGNIEIVLLLVNSLAAAMYILLIIVFSCWIEFWRLRFGYGSPVFYAFSLRRFSSLPQHRRYQSVCL